MGIRILKKLLPLLFAVLLAACLPKTEEHKPLNVDIGMYHVGDHTFYVPKPYVTSIGDESLLLESYYPGNAPVLRTWQELKDQGNVYKTISILMTDLSRYENFTPEKGLSALINLFQATKVTGKEYGLKHHTQPDGIENEWGEIWVESSEPKSIAYITCKTKAKKPQCSYNFFGNDFEYKISFDKRLLPEWKTVRHNVLELIDSLHSEEAAKAYFRDQYDLVFDEQMNGIQ
jgi:hypothetical protein